MFSELANYGIMMQFSLKSLRSWEAYSLIDGTDPINRCLLGLTVANYTSLDSIREFPIRLISV
jgi:hypothetical protein